MLTEDIAKILKLTAQIMELHEENPFKIKAYQNILFLVDQRGLQLADVSQENLLKIEGISSSMAEKILEIQARSSHQDLDQYLAKTPKGVLDLLGIKGLGPKKVRTLWKELNIDNKESLLLACETNLVAQAKGFGEKTQTLILESLAFEQEQKGKIRIDKALLWSELWLDLCLKNAFPGTMYVVGELRRNLEVISELNFVFTSPDRLAALDWIKKTQKININPNLSGPYTLIGIWEELEVVGKIFYCEESELGNVLYQQSSSLEHLSLSLTSTTTIGTALAVSKFSSENAFFKSISIQEIVPELREGFQEVTWALEQRIPILLHTQDLKGAFHNHSVYSDGANTLRDIAQYGISQGYQYIGMADHSKAAYYANGLSEEKVYEQWSEIDSINKEFAPFKLFKGIEADILADGSLDYSLDLLSKFDFVVASIHSNLVMDQEKAHMRLIKAIEHPCTTFLGHPTGRLLLKRAGYPIDHAYIIDACVANGVIIEVNANPWRLDLDWRWIAYGLEKGLILSINPDAHELAGYTDMEYGVKVARKGGLTAKDTFNAWNLEEIEAYLGQKKSSL